MKARLAAINIFNALKKRQKTATVFPAAIWQNPFYFIAFGFGSGAIPMASGTFGTLMAIPFYLLLSPLPLIPYIIFVIAFIAFSSWICERVSRDMQVHDHPGIVIDEFVGFFVTMINAPLGWRWLLLGFLLFRLFDVWKPWPIRFFDVKVKGGFGIVLDDVLAGVYALIIMQLLKFLLK